MRCSKCQNHYNDIIHDVIKSERAKYNVHVCPVCDNIDYIPVMKRKMKFELCGAR